MKPRWTRRAFEDLRHLHEYISQDNPAAANRMVSRIRDAVERLGRHPHMGAKGRVEFTRELIIAGTPYIVVYVEDRGRVQIAAVIHGAMRWPDSFEGDKT